ncbi:metallophosphoesterase [bacterium]|nr:metallophosphoesterase [bacterium]
MTDAPASVDPSVPRAMKIAFFAVLFAVTLGGAALMQNQIDLYDVHLVRADAPPIIANALAGTKMLVLADLHVRDRAPNFGPRERFILKTIDETDPDTILIVGDHFPFTRSIEPSLEFFEALRSDRNIYAVLGDHEYHGARKSCVYCHAPGDDTWSVREDLAVKMLRDQVVTISGPTGTKVDIWGGDVKSSPDLSWTKVTPPDRPVIAMTHFPEAFDDYADAGADLMLGADTHGGQMIAPHIFYEWLLGPRRAHYLAGRFTRGKSVLWVTKGVGWSILPLRLGVKPDILLFDFTK